MRRWNVRSAWPLLLGLVTAPAAGQTLTAETCASVREHVLPSIEEQMWRRIPWRDALGGAVLEADELGKPVLLWAMNGHPLGAT